MKGVNRLKEEFEAKIEENNYVGNMGWIEESSIEPTNGELFEDIIKKYQGKKVKITIQELD
jgi:hypothetical protein